MGIVVFRFRTLTVLFSSPAEFLNYDHLFIFFIFQVQRYEGASTIYGPHTLSAYVHKFRGLARAIAQVSLTGIEPEHQHGGSCPLIIST